MRVHLPCHCQDCLEKWCYNRLDDYAKSKITVLGEDYKEHLLAYMHESQLPEFLGGTFRSELEEAKAESAPEQEQNIAAVQLV